MYEWAHCYDEAANHQLPRAVTFWITQITSVKECSSLMQNLMQIGRSTHSDIVTTTATYYTCSLNGVYRPHWLVQWSHHCSCMRIPVHCPWLPGYIDVAQTLLVLFNNGLTFLNRPHIHRSHFTLTLKFKKCWILATIELQFHPSFFVLSLSYKFVHSLYVLSPKGPFVVIILCSCLLNKKKRRRYISIVIYLTM